VSAEAAAVFRESGMVVRENFGTIDSFEKTETGVRMNFSKDGQQFSTEAALAVVAIRWMADTTGLNLAAAGVELNQRKFVKVDDYLRTSAPHIFAAGDIIGRRNRDMVLTVRGDIVDRVQAPDVSKEVEPKLQSIKDALPYGYRIETGGSIEESVKANSALVAVFPDHGHRDAGDFDDSAAELLASGLGVRDGAARADWRDRGAAHLESTVRLRGPARVDCARRHDHAQHRDPG